MKKRKRACCGIGADRAPGRFWRENGECRVYGRGAPRRKSVGLLAADGEWDARMKHTPRPAKVMVGKTDGECRVHERGAPRRKSVSLLVADGEWDA